MSQLLSIGLFLRKITTRYLIPFIMSAGIVLRYMLFSWRRQFLWYDADTILYHSIKDFWYKLGYHKFNIVGNYVYAENTSSNSSITVAHFVDYGAKGMLISCKVNGEWNHELLAVFRLKRLLKLKAFL